MTNERMDEPVPDRGDIKVVTTVTGSDQYRIVATAAFDSAPVEVWALLSDWERLVAVGLRGMTSDFKWLSGGPDEVPSTFQFRMAGATLKEEIYERTAEEAAGRYRLCIGRWNLHSACSSTTLFSSCGGLPERTLPSRPRVRCGSRPERRQACWPEWSSPRLIV